MKKCIVLEVANLSTSSSEFKRTGIQEVIYQVLLSTIKVREKFPNYDIVLLPALIQNFYNKNYPSSNLGATPEFIFELIESELKLPSKDIWGFDFKDKYNFRLSNEVIFQTLKSADFVHFQSLYEVQPLLKYMKNELKKNFLKTSMTIYDITPILMPEHADDDLVKWFKKKYLPGIVEVNELICISRHTLIDLWDYILPQKTNIQTSYIHLPSYNYDFNLKHSLNLTINDLIENQYFVFIGSVEPRKNILKLLKSFKLFLEKTGLDYKLVFIGQSGWKNNREFELIKNDVKLKRQVKFTGYLSDNDVFELLQKSAGLCMISSYEGFGLPLSLAHTLGVPVLTSFGSSLPEACRYDAIFVDSSDEYSIASGLIKLLRLPKKQPVRSFNWINYTEKLIRKAANIS